MFRHHMTKKFLLLICIGIGCGIALPSASGSGASLSTTVQKESKARTSAKSFHIFMFLFNGRGELERGFTNYFRRRNINIKYTIRDCRGDFANCPLQEYIAEAKSLRPDLIYTWGTPITTAVAGKINQANPKDNITSIPIIALPIANPVGVGFTKKMGGGTKRNLLGVSQMMSVQRQVQAMRLYNDKVKVIGTLYTPFEHNIVAFIEAFQKNAQEMDVQFISYPIPLLSPGVMDGSKIAGLIDQLAQKKIDFLYLGPDTKILDFTDVIIERARYHHIPTFASSGLTISRLKPMFGFFSRFYHVGQLGASMALNILQKKKGYEKQFKFETLKHMSMILNISEILNAKVLTPPVLLLKFSEIIGDIQEEKAQTKPQQP